jgi:hypothetical protein
LALETTQNADRHNHHQYPEGDAIGGYAHQGASICAQVAREKALCYKRFKCQE